MASWVSCEDCGAHLTFLTVFKLGPAVLCSDCCKKRLRIKAERACDEAWERNR